MTYALIPWAPVFPWYLEIQPLDFCELYTILKLSLLAATFLFTSLQNSFWIGSYDFSKVGLRRNRVFSRWRQLGFMRWTFCLKGVDMFFMFITTCRHLYSCRYVSFKLTKHVDRFILVMRWALCLARTACVLLLLPHQPVGMFCLSLRNLSTCSRQWGFRLSPLFAAILHDFHHSY